MNQALKPISVDIWEVIAKDTIRMVHKTIKPQPYYDILMSIKKLYKQSGVCRKFKEAWLPWIAVFDDVMSPDDKKKLYDAIDCIRRRKSRIMRDVHEELLETVFHPDRLMRVGKDTFLQTIG